MNRHFLFLSYKRGAETTPVVEGLHRRIKATLSKYGVESFFDRKSIEAGEPWEERIDEFMAKTTLFVALISVDFWLSEQCRRELDLAIKRYESGAAAPKLLFVLADQLDPGDLSFDEEQATRHIAADSSGSDAKQRLEIARQRVQKVRSIAQFNWLGPYHPESGALVRLAFEDKYKVMDQLAQLVNSIKALKGMAQ